MKQSDDKFAHRYADEAELKVFLFVTIPLNRLRSYRCNFIPLNFTRVRPSECSHIFFVSNLLAVGCSNQNRYDLNFTKLMIHFRHGSNSETNFS